MLQADRNSARNPVNPDCRQGDSRSNHVLQLPLIRLAAHDAHEEWHGRMPAPEGAGDPITPTGHPELPHLARLQP